MAIVLRSVKGSPLTITEVDGNFTTLDSGKLDKTGGTSLYLGTGANNTRFPNALTVISNTASGIQQNEPHNAGLISEGTGSSLTTTISGTSGATSITVGSATGILIGQLITGTGIAPNATVTNIVSTTITVSLANTGTVSGTGTFSNIGVGVYGKGYAAGAARSGGVVGEGHVSATGDTGSAIGVRGYANDTHSGGMNIGLYGDATGGASNYSLYLNRGGIYSAGVQSWTLNGNLTLSGAYTVTIPTLSLGNALPIASGGTGSTSLTANNVLLGNGTNALQVVAPGTNGNILTSNGTTWVSAAAPITLPSQTSNNGKFLTTDGTTASWGTIPISLPSQSGAGGKFLTTDGSTATWSSIPLVDNTYTVTGISGTAATIAVDFSTVSSSTIIIPLPTGTTSATITFTNLASKATSGTIFSFSVILSHVTALTNTTSVAWRHGSALLPKWTGNIIPPSTVTANAIDIWTFFTYDAGSSLVGSLSMADVRNA
jgi:hypothetical protein